MSLDSVRMARQSHANQEPVGTIEETPHRQRSREVNEGSCQRAGSPISKAVVGNDDTAMMGSR